MDCSFLAVPEGMFPKCGSGCIGVADPRGKAFFGQRENHVVQDSFGCIKQVFSESRIETTLYFATLGGSALQNYVLLNAPFPA